MSDASKNSNHLLFHYTSVENAISILKSGELYFTNYNNLNDLKEFTFADEILMTTAVHQALDEFLKKDGYFKIHKRGRDYRNVIKIDSKNLINAASEALGKDYYVFSTTIHDNHYDANNGTLIMWRGYGNRDGCAIAFNKKKLIGLVENLSLKKKIASCTCDHVHYIHNEVDISKLFKEDYNSFVRYLKYIANSTFYPKGPFVYHDLDGLSPYIKMKSLIKHPSFASESEFRLGMLRNIPNVGQIESDLIFTDQKKIKLFIRESIMPIKKIILSPLTDQVESYKKLKSILDSSPEFLNIEITKSEIPYRTI